VSRRSSACFRSVLGCTPGAAHTHLLRQHAPARRWRGEQHRAAIVERAGRRGQLEPHDVVGQLGGLTPQHPIQRLRLVLEQVEAQPLRRGLWRDAARMRGGSGRACSSEVEVQPWRCELWHGVAQGWPQRACGDARLGRLGRIVLETGAVASPLSAAALRRWCARPRSSRARSGHPARSTGL
jgi:hypothetical protein